MMLMHLNAITEIDGVITGVLGELQRLESTLMTLK